MKTLLVDGNNVAVRAIFAAKSSGMSSHGTPTGALLIIINTLSRHIREEKPDRVGVFWDAPGRDWRKDLDPEYKANRNTAHDDYRDDTFHLAKEFLTLSGIPHEERRGYEADDLIAAHWRSIPKTGDDDSIVILSSDKDFMMLLGRNPQGVETEQVRLSSSGTPTDRWDEARVMDELRYWPRHIPLLMALSGDTSDNIPGVPRFGMKTAAKVLAASGWSLEGIDDPRVVEHWDRVQTNLALVDLRSPIASLVIDPLPPFRPSDPTTGLYTALVKFLINYEMKSVLSRVHDQTLWKDD